MPLLSACGGGGKNDRKEGTTSGKDAQKILPAFVASNVVTPDIPAKNGSAAGFTSDPHGRAQDVGAEEAGQRRQALGHGALLGHPPKGRQPVLHGHERGHRRRGRLAEPGRRDLRPETRRGPRLQRHPRRRGRPRLEPQRPHPQRRQRQVRGPRPLPVRRQGQGLPGTWPRSRPRPGSAASSAACSGRSRCRPRTSPTSPRSTAGTFAKKGYSVPKSPEEFLSWAKEATDAKSELWACDDMKWTAFNIFGVLSGSDKALVEPGGRQAGQPHRDRRVPRSPGVDTNAVRRRGGPPRRGAGARRAATPATGSPPGRSWSTTRTSPTGGARRPNSAPRTRTSTSPRSTSSAPTAATPTLWAVQPANIFTLRQQEGGQAADQGLPRLCNYCAAPYGTKEFMLTAYGVEGTDYDLKSGLPVKTQQGVNEVNGAFDYTGNPPRTSPTPTSPRSPGAWSSGSSAWAPSPRSPPSSG